MTEQINLGFEAEAQDEAARLYGEFGPTRRGDDRFLIDLVMLIHSRLKNIPVANLSQTDTAYTTAVRDAAWDVIHRYSNEGDAFIFKILDKIEKILGRDKK